MLASSDDDFLWVGGTLDYFWLAFGCCLLLENLFFMFQPHTETKIKSAAFTSFLSSVSSTHTFLLSDQFENYVFWFFSSYSFDFYFLKGTQFFRKRDSTCFHLKAMPGRAKKKMTATYRKTSFVMRSRLREFSRIRLVFQTIGWFVCLISRLSRCVLLKGISGFTINSSSA